MARQIEQAKRATLLEYAKRFGVKVCVETGTYTGDTVEAMFNSGWFRRIDTIEIYPDRAERARKRFIRMSRVHCWAGDSATVLPVVLEQFARPALFWLDAHHSGKKIARVKGLVETPVVAELKTILGHVSAPKHVILIDDAHYFETFPKKHPAYPTTRVLEDTVRAVFPDWAFYTENDIIRIHRVDG
jgi:hypothetical protein